jgi:hypothetical protein
MSKKTRFIIAIAAILALVLLVLGVDFFRREAPLCPLGTGTPPAAGSIPIYVNGELVAYFTPADLDKLPKASFVEPVEGKTQDGWMLEDVLRLYIPERMLTPATIVVVSSTSRDKSARLSMPEVNDAANLVMFDLSNRGTLKLVSVLPKLSTRDQWVQDVDKIELQVP